MAMSWHMNHWLRDSDLDFKQNMVPENIWQKLIHLPCLKGLRPDELNRLHQLAAAFLYKKNISSTNDLKITDEIRVTIAIQACLLILNLDLEYYDNWNEVIIYPGEFLQNYDYTDETGTKYRSHKIVSGETWQTGSVILSWQDIDIPPEHYAPHKPHNIVIHEFAHKLDILHEGANGCPLLHPNMSETTWRDIFNSHYTAFCKQSEYDTGFIINSYATENKSEFFAALSESFFESPIITKHYMPAVYEQLALFYRQDPASRWSISEYHYPPSPQPVRYTT